MPVVLITAGPTQEPIDPIRFISNRSSGIMGYALATEALKKKFEVILISGPTQLKPPRGVTFIPVETAQEMRQAVLKNYKKADIIFKVAAVADWRVKTISKQKLKKGSAQSMSLTLVKNPDILFELGKKKKKNQILVGFAAETKNLIPYAKKKLKEKNCDWIVANNVKKHSVFGNSHNTAVLIGENGEEIKIPNTTKNAMAKKILQSIIRQ